MISLAHDGTVRRAVPIVCCSSASGGSRMGIGWSWMSSFGGASCSCRRVHGTHGTDEPTETAATHEKKRGNRRHESKASDHNAHGGKRLPCCAAAATGPRTAAAAHGGRPGLGGDPTAGARAVRGLLRGARPIHAPGPHPQHHRPGQNSKSPQSPHMNIRGGWGGDRTRFSQRLSRIHVK